MSTERMLYNYFRSSSSYRVRIALNLKSLPFAYLAVHLNRHGGEQFSHDFQALNPQQLVPLLLENGHRISQSLAIIEYLEETYPEHPLLPPAPEDRAYVRQIANTIACEMHPLNNLRVLKYLTEELKLTDAAKKNWVHHWNELGLQALEKTILDSPKRGQFVFGNTPTIADCCLVPQLFNAQRFDVDLTPYPTLRAIATACGKLKAFELAHPGMQPDSE
ncbi:maleylacetoacetate isomerase [Undibacterium sp. Ji50W]|uniref:maleylacetoacetate isomerase n=1 Tax=Undibacterium sp. Ji50W TaxID=3413041 RepID=UPI003BF30153